MSRSNNTEISNPSTRWFEWAGGDGKVKYYDRETKENVYVDLPFTFLVLDVLSTVTGFSDERESGIFSNEVRDIRTDIFVVRTKQGELIKGTWEKVKATTGTRYTQSAYIAYKDGQELKLGNIKFAGSGVGPWIDFRKSNDIYKGAISITGAEPKKKGKTDYFEPVFAAKPVAEETDEQAKELDVILQEYLKAYFSRDSSQDNGHDEPAFSGQAKAAAAGSEPEMPPFVPTEPIDNDEVF